MNEELNALAEILHSCGWTSPSDAQWTRLEAAIPDIRDALSAPPAAVAVPDGMVLVRRKLIDESIARINCAIPGWEVHVHALNDALAAAPASPAATGWQPIETAPKDGTFFIATGFNYGKSSDPRHYCMALWEQGEWREASEWNGHSSLAYLTHWRPLPPAPSVDGEG